MPIIDNPGLTIIAIDPGTTTGIAIWDSWSQTLFVDQVDSGRGRKARMRLWPEVTESPKREQVKRGMKKQGVNVERGRGVETEMEIMHRIEAGVAQVLIDLCMAAGPKAVVIVEDFILGWGNPQKVGSSKREGLSPVRITARFRQKMEDGGLLSGDAWRNWDGFGIKGQDGRGVKVVRSSLGKQMDFKQRLSDVERWRLGVEDPDVSGLERGLWPGGGQKWIQQMPGQRIFLPGGEARVKEWLKERNQWMTSAPHGMDALMHMMAFARKIGCDIPKRGERIWVGGETLKESRVTTKAVSG